MSDSVAPEVPLLLSSPILWGLLIAALGLWVMMSGPAVLAKRIGPVLGLVGLGVLGFGMRRWAPLPNLEQVVFWILALVTIGGAAAAVSARSPIYTAIWFAGSLLGLGGLFVLQHAQFLGVATVVVYAGAIVVTFLFVLMLAQPDGDASYDRLSWASFAPLAAVAAATCFVVLLVAAITASELPAAAEATDIAHPEHLARMGGELFSRHLVAVELAGTLLLVALVGAIAIVIHGRSPAEDAVRVTARLDEQRLRRAGS